jgi:hypothetical protein
MFHMREFFAEANQYLSLAKADEAEENGNEKLWLTAYFYFSTPIHLLC